MTFYFLFFESKKAPSSKNKTKKKNNERKTGTLKLVSMDRFVFLKETKL